MLRNSAVSIAILLLAGAFNGCKSSWDAHMNANGSMVAREDQTTWWPVGESAVQFGKVSHSNSDGTTDTTQTLTMVRTKNTIGNVTLAGIAAGAAIAVAGGGSPPAVGAGAAVAGAGALADGAGAISKAKKK